ncbi:MAG: hypothetical protein IJQ66_07370, partial [Clostridia bacterium]|nr:hypothetical protein [Clostridia bacterium]
PVTMTISDIVLTELIPSFDMANTETVIDANSEINIASVAGVSNVNGTMSYTVTDKNGANVTVTNGKFTSGTAQNYYDITATATINGRQTSKTTRFIVKGTFIASSGYSAISYANNNLTATKLSNDSLTNFRLYLDGLEDYEVGDLVYVTMNYRADVESKASQKFLVIGKNTGSNTYPAITINADSTITFVAAVCTADNDFTGMVNLTTLSGNRAKHIKVETWFYNAATDPKGHVTGSFTIKSVYVSKIKGSVDVVNESSSGGTAYVNSDGNIVFENSAAWSQYRLYLDALNDYAAGDTVRVTIKYKTVNATTANNQYRVIYGTGSGTSTGFFNVVKDGADYSTATIDAMVYTGGGHYPYSGNAIISGDLGKHLKLTTLFTSNPSSTFTVQILIDSITISPVT